MLDRDTVDGVLRVTEGRNCFWINGRTAASKIVIFHLGACWTGIQWIVVIFHLVLIVVIFHLGACWTGIFVIFPMVNVKA
jgi:hypothetical protein